MLKEICNKKLELGNLDAYRDWGHSKDYVDAMHKLPFNINLSIKYHDFKDTINFDVYGRELDFVLSKDLPFGGKIIQGFSIYYPENRSRLESGYFMLIINL